MLFRSNYVVSQSRYESVEVKRENGIGFIKEVWQEMFTLTEEEIKQLKGISEEAVLWAE